jgi:hypothetical protein
LKNLTIIFYPLVDIIDPLWKWLQNGLIAKMIYPKLNELNFFTSYIVVEFLKC